MLRGERTEKSAKSGQLYLRKWEERVRDYRMLAERMQDAVEGRRNDDEHGASYEQLRLNWL